MNENIRKNDIEGLAETPKLKKLPSWRAIVSTLAILVLIYLFFSRDMLRFYLSLLFFYYSFLGQMWWSVIGIGITQTLLLLPLRFLRVNNQSRLEEFEEKLRNLKDPKDQTFYIKKQVRRGVRAISFHTVDFMVQLTTYLTIGRMFLKDFYNVPLERELLYSFVPFPNYPIQGTIYKIPFPWFGATRDFGIEILIWIWIVIVLSQVAIFAVRFLVATLMRKVKDEDFHILPKKLTRYASGYVVILMILSFILVRFFPINWELRFFTGSVQWPNPRFNTLTAVMTFLTLLWFGINRIKRDVEVAREKGFEPEFIKATYRGMFWDTLRNALLVGLGAYLITNQIPSAFELSIFTLEIISLTMPLTIDKLIFAAVKRRREAKLAPVEAADTSEKGSIISTEEKE